MNLNKYFKDNIKELLSIILMLIPAFYLFGKEMNYLENQTIFGFIPMGVKEIKVKFDFGMLSTLITCALYFPVIIRNYSKNIGNIMNWVQHIANIVLISILLNAVLGGDQAKDKDVLIPLLNITLFQLLAISILFSWLGMSSVAGFSWIFCFIGILINLQQTDYALGTSGGIVILLPFLSILIQLFLPDFGIDQLSDFGSQFFNSNTSNRIKSDIHSSANATKNVVRKIANKFNQ